MKIIGHRGAKGLAPENTIASFQLALDHHVDAIELDVQLTKDSQLVCSHDLTIATPGGKWHSIPKHTYADLLKHKPDLATLTQAITLVNRRVPIVIEIKKGATADSIIECVQGFLDKGWQMSDFEFCSFMQPPLLALHKAFPTAELIPNERWSSVKACARARQLSSKRISIKQDWLWRGYLRVMHQQGWKVSSYTINSVSRGRKWEPYLYALYTDYPDRFET
jgi:glycerophosphoryl diester phosphodiesterase